MRKHHLPRFCKFQFILLLGLALFVLNSAKAQQTGTISGKIIDDNGKGLPGVMVKVVQLNKPTMTNDAGVYIFQVPQGLHHNGFTYFLFVWYKNSCIG